VAAAAVRSLEDAAIGVGRFGEEVFFEASLTGIFMKGSEEEQVFLVLRTQF